jgi:hypothetical protein
MCKTRTTRDAAIPVQIQPTMSVASKSKSKSKSTRTSGTETTAAAEPHHSGLSPFDDKMHPTTAPTTASSRPQRGAAAAALQRMRQALDVRVTPHQKSSPQSSPSAHTLASSGVSSTSTSTSTRPSTSGLTPEAAVTLVLKRSADDMYEIFTPEATFEATISTTVVDTPYDKNTAVPVDETATRASTSTSTSVSSPTSQKRSTSRPSRKAKDSAVQGMKLVQNEESKKDNFEDYDDEDDAHHHHKTLEQQQQQQQPATNTKAASKKRRRSTGPEQAQAQAPAPASASAPAPADEDNSANKPKMSKAAARRLPKATRVHTGVSPTASSSSKATAAAAAATNPRKRRPARGASKEIVDYTEPMDTPIDEEEEEEDPKEQSAALLALSLETGTDDNDTAEPSKTPNEAAARLVSAAPLRVPVSTAAADDFVENAIRTRRKASGGANKGRKIERTRTHSSSKAKRTPPKKIESLAYVSPPAKNSIPVESSSPPTIETATAAAIKTAEEPMKEVAEEGTTTQETRPTEEPAKEVADEETKTQGDVLAEQPKQQRPKSCSSRPADPSQDSVANEETKESSRQDEPSAEEKKETEEEASTKSSASKKQKRRSSSRRPSEPDPSATHPPPEEKKDEEPLPPPYQVMTDPNPFYIEEEAHLYHNPPLPSATTQGVLPKDLSKIPPPEPMSSLPNTGHCNWTYDATQLVLLADFSLNTSHPLIMNRIDELFFLQMLERTEITVISQGLLDWQRMDPRIWRLPYVCGVLNREFYHKFRRFDTIIDPETGFEQCSEIDVMYSMRMRDYHDYVERRRRQKNTTDVDFDPMFTFVDHEERERTIHVGISALYMIDFDMNKLLPPMYANLQKSFRYPGVLPGGEHCMMNSVG